MARFLYAMKYLPPSVRVWEYELYGGRWGPVGPTSPVCMYVFARFLTPPKGVWEGPRALIHLPQNTRCRFLFPPPCAFLALASSPRVLGKCACFCAEGIGSPSPVKEGGSSCGGSIDYHIKHSCRLACAPITSSSKTPFASPRRRPSCIAAVFATTPLSQTRTSTRPAPLHRFCTDLGTVPTP